LANSGGLYAWHVALRIVLAADNYLVREGGGKLISLRSSSSGFCNAESTSTLWRPKPTCRPSWAIWASWASMVSSFG
jgi:hypothetical protein